MSETPNVSSVPPDEGTPSHPGSEAVSTGVHHGRSSRRGASKPHSAHFQRVRDSLSWMQGSLRPGTLKQSREAADALREIERDYLSLEEQLEALHRIADNFLPVTDPLDMWLCIDGDYVRPATSQESAFVLVLKGPVAGSNPATSPDNGWHESAAHTPVLQPLGACGLVSGDGRYACIKDLGHEGPHGSDPAKRPA